MGISLSVFLVLMVMHGDHDRRVREMKLTAGQPLLEKLLEKAKLHLVFDNP